ncbi:MarR family transcriptional regulator [Longimycelium tulufanense]|uniref:MarR family transcriptional regulator n=1 Tax=Longimycelium tulufanense TaxID=907463 RepID=A0A8J3CGQ3_9PSEU|nr:MarR family transcriptional regulator [Longimycelium tulufanense]GGM63546.1 MarR family transcriptional regulator [Longimycelium tulufanense]
MTTAGRDDAAVSRFIERFASALVEAGIPRMPARVFTALMSSDSGRLTAAELAEQLRVSPAAISGAVRYLGQVNLVTREREPGSRRDHYQVHDNVWYEAILRRDQILHRWESILREGLTALGPATPAGVRVNVTLEFFEFLQRELPAVLARWREYQAERREHQASRP